MKKYVYLSLFFIVTTLYGQELEARVEIDYTQVQISDPSIFDNMKSDFREFISNRKWTNDDFESHERIKCNFLITITSSSVDVFGATVQIISSRPVYGTEYETIILNFADRDWSFQYRPERPINFNENSFTNNLSSLFAFYAYVIIGLDYDTFGELAGSKYFQEASNIVNQIPESSIKGWNQFGSNKNRFWLIENLLSPALEDLRLALYKYHRLGLDRMIETPNEAKNAIAESLQNIQKSNRSRPRSVLTISIMNAKATELANIFSSGDLTVRKKVYEILTQIDPSKIETYKSIIE